MAGFKGLYYDNLIVNAEYNHASLVFPATWYFTLFTVNPGADGTGGTELAFGVNGYSGRLAVTANTTNFPTVTLGQILNAVAMNFGTPTGPGWGTIVGMGQYDASGGGNLWRVEVANPAVVGSPGVPFIVPIGGFSAGEV